MSEKIVVQARVDLTTKRAAEAVLIKHGLDLPTLVRMVVCSVANEKKIPFFMSTAQNQGGVVPQAGGHLPSEDCYEFELADRIYADHLRKSKKSHSFSKLLKAMGC